MLVTDDDQTRGSVEELFLALAGRVGSGGFRNLTGRVGSGRAGSGRVESRGFQISRVDFGHCPSRTRAK